MSTLTDNPAYTPNEIYQIAQTDPVEGSATDASFDGIGVTNQPHQQLANRTAFLKSRQDTNIASIAALQAFVTSFTGSLQSNGYLKIPISDVARGSVNAIVQWGFYSLLPGVSVAKDAQYVVQWPIAFPNGILLPPFATNYYNKTGGMNTVASVVSYSKSGGVFVLDVPGSMLGDPDISGSDEISNGFSWLAIGF